MRLKPTNRRIAFHARLLLAIRTTVECVKSACGVRRHAILILCGMWIGLIANPVAAQEDSLKGELAWKNGDRIPGTVLSGNKTHLQWQARLFRDPLDIDLKYLDQIDFKFDALLRKTQETFAIQTIDGFSLFGEVTRLDNRFLEVHSRRFGNVRMDRKRIATVLNLKTSGSLLNGEFDLDKWDANRNEKKFWMVNDQGDLVSMRRNVHLFMKAELPESALIEVELAWEKKLDFTFGFGVPRNSRKIESLPRLESWDDSIVLSYNDDFEIVLESSDSELKRLKFLIHWNRQLNQLVIHDEQGKQLAAADLGETPANVEPGIYLENKSGDLQVTSLMVRRSAEGFNATLPSIQTVDRAAINGTVQSFDGSDWVITTVGGEDAGSVQTIQSDNFCGAFLMNPAVARPLGQTRLKFQDGMFVGGDFVGIEDDSVTIKTGFSNDAMTLALTGAGSLRFGAPWADETDSDDFSNRLLNRAGEIHGRLEKGSGDVDDIMRWRVAGASSAAPLSNGDAKIMLQEKQTIVDVDDQWADTLYMTNRDTIPCRIVSMDETHVTIESFSENNRIDQRFVKAIDLRNHAVAEDVSAGGKEWVIPGKSKSRIKVQGESMQVAKNAEFGHPWLFSSGGFEFDLSWKNNGYGILECRTLVGNLNSNEGGKRVNIMLYGQNLFVSNPGENNPRKGMMEVNKSKARFKFQYQQGKLVITVNGKKAYSEKVGFGANRGRGVWFRLNDMHQQNISCTLSDFKLVHSDLGNGAMVDAQRKELLLTIPRLKQKNPPRQIICATNGDMLRGELVSLSDEYLFIRTNGEVKRFPREIVASVVWLNADNLVHEDSDADSELPGGDTSVVTTSNTGPGEPGPVESTLTNQVTPDAGQTVQILMQGGRRMTLTLKSWNDERLVGGSESLGRCRVPLSQIYELRLGAFADQAMDIPYADWVATLAPAPKMETGSDGSLESGFAFGSGSPLIGTRPKSFAAKMVGGKQFSLKSHLGKVVVLDFWATWCGPCVQALPKLEETMAQYSTDQVTFLAVNQEESMDQIVEFLESRGLKIPVALDSGQIGRQFRVDSLPKTIVIDQDGNVAFVKVGTSRGFEKKLKTAIDLLLSDDENENDKVF